MILRKAAVALGAAFAVATFVSIAPARASANPIAIQQCFITVPKAMSKNASGTQIDYVNTSRKTATHITFVVTYRNSSSNYVRKVIDQGTFAPGAQVQHHFDLYSDVIFGGKTVQSCQATRVVYNDGSTWSL